MSPSLIFRIFDTYPESEHLQPTTPVAAMGEGSRGEGSVRAETHR